MTLPRTIAVARFLGERPMNLLSDGDAIIGIRPEHVRLDGDGALRGRIVRRETTGADAYSRSRRRAARSSSASRRRARARAGELVGLDLPPQHVRRFDPCDRDRDRVTATALLARGVVMAGIAGARLDNDFPRFGGYLLFARGATLAQVRALTDALRARDAATR